MDANHVLGRRAVGLRRGLAAQTITATLSGVIADPHGAAIPNATVTVISADTGIRKTARTDGGLSRRLAAAQPRSPWARSSRSVA